MSWLRSLLRRFRDERATTLALILLLVVTSLVAGLAPRVLGVIARDALHAEVAAARAPARNVQLIEERRVPANASDPFRGIRTVGERREERIPESVRALFVDRTALVDTSRWTVLNADMPASTVALRFQPGAENRVRVVDGRPPTGATRTIVVPLDEPGVAPPPGSAPEEPDDPDVPEEPRTIEITVLEATLSTESAELLRVRVGDTLELEVDATDRLGRGHGDRLAIDVVGIFEVTDPADDFWFEDTALVRPSVREIGTNFAFFDATALLAPEALPALMRVTEPSGLPFTYTWRYRVAPERLDVDTVDALLADLRRLEVTFPTAAVATGAPTTQLRTDLVRVVERQRLRWRSAEAVLTVVAVGPAAVAGAAVALVAVLAASRRRASLAVWRARGASLGQVGAATVIEGLLLGLPAAGLAVAVAVLLVPDGRDPPTLGAVGAVILVAVMLLLAAVLRTTVAESGGRPQEAAVRRPSARRLVLEGLVVALAVAGALLLRDRGIRGASSSAALEAADPFIAAVPLLVGLAAGLVAVRLAPLPLAAFAALAAMRRDLVPSLALRRATRAGAAPVLLVLLATTAVGGFASAALVHLDRSADGVAWQEVGAAYRVTGSSTALFGADVSSLPADAVATGYLASVPVGGGGVIRRADVLVLDAAAYADVARGTPNESVVPPPLLEAAEGPIPAIVGTALAEGSTGAELDEVLDVSIAGARVRVRAVEFRASFPGAPLDGRFVVLARDQLQATRPDDPLPVTDLFIRASESPEGAAPLAAWAAAEAPRAAFVDRRVTVDELRGGPIPAAVTAGIAAATAVSAAYAALAVIVALALAGAARAAEVAHLRTLGLGRRQAVGLLVVEHGPVVALAFVGGAVLGFGLFALLHAGLGVESVLGTALSVPIRIDPVQVVVLLVAVGALAALGIAVGAAIQRRAVLAAALRRGIE